MYKRTRYSVYLVLVQLYSTVLGVCWKFVYPHQATKMISVLLGVQITVINNSWILNTRVVSSLFYLVIIIILFIHLHSFDWLWAQLLVQRPHWRFFLLSPPHNLYLGKRNMTLVRSDRVPYLSFFLFNLFELVPTDSLIESHILFDTSPTIPLSDTDTLIDSHIFLGTSPTIPMDYPLHWKLPLRPFDTDTLIESHIFNSSHFNIIYKWLKSSSPFLFIDHHRDSFLTFSSFFFSSITIGIPF